MHGTYLFGRGNSKRECCQCKRMTRTTQPECYTCRNNNKSRERYKNGYKLGNLIGKELLRYLETRAKQ